MVKSVKIGGPKSSASMVELLFGLQIPPTELGTQQSVGDLARTLERQISAVREQFIDAGKDYLKEAEFVSDLLDFLKELSKCRAVWERIGEGRFAGSTPESSAATPAALGGGGPQAAAAVSLGSVKFHGCQFGQTDMPKGPKGEKRPADVIGNAVKVMRIATGEQGTRPQTLAIMTVILVAGAGNSPHPRKVHVFQAFPHLSTPHGVAARCSNFKVSQI